MITAHPSVFPTPPHQDFPLIQGSGNTWGLFTGRDPQAACHMQMNQDLAWRLFTKGISRELARRQAHIKHNVDLGRQVLELVAIMA